MGFFFAGLLIYGGIYLTLALLPGIKSMAVAVVLLLSGAIWLYRELTLYPDVGPGGILLMPLIIIVALAAVLGFAAWAIRMVTPRRLLLQSGIVLAIGAAPIIWQIIVLAR